MKRIFWIVLDSAGIGEAPDADKFGDIGSNTWKSCYDSGKLHIPNMEKIGIYQIDGMEYAKSTENPTGSFARMQELSCGKDTTTGHWEMAGIVTPDPLPKFPNGFPKAFIEEFSKRTGRKILCNLPYSGTQVIHDYGREQEETGALIVYTSADSVCQIAAHEEIIPVEQLYEYCKIAREMLTGDLGVGKTVFTQGLAKGLGIEEPVNSPTFTIVQVYDEGRLPLYHFDVYRIGDVEEMDEIGYEDYFYGDGVCLIEWANLIEEILPEKYTEIRIEKDLEKGFDYRKITVTEVEA